MASENSIYKNTSIIILTCNNIEYTRECIESIRENTKEGSYELVIVDNASKDGTREWLAMQKDLQIILNDENLGFPKGCNIGIQASNEENDILLLNNDTRVYENWLVNLKKALYSNDTIGAVGSSTLVNFIGACDHLGNKIDFIGNDMKAIESFAKENNNSTSGKWAYTNRLMGFCFLIKRSVLNKVGLLDEGFSPGTYEDNDLSLRIIKEGYYLLVCYDSYIHHYAGTSFDYESPSYKELLDRNSKKFAEKWGLYEEDIYRVRDSLISKITKDENSEINVLQWQCDLGGTLLAIKTKFKNARLYAIEENKVYIPFIKNIAKVSTIGSFPLQFEKRFFDYIIVGNKINEVENPMEYLKSLSEYLKKDGYLLLEVQNM